MTPGGGDILVTGATGFTGTAVLRALLARGAGPRVRVLARGPVPEWARAAGVRVHQGDLADASGLTGLCTGVSTLVHLAVRITGTAGDCAAVNEHGTARLLAEAHRAGTRRIVHQSTCAVYRDGEHRAAPEPRAPAWFSGRPGARVPAAPGAASISAPAGGTAGQKVRGGAAPGVARAACPVADVSGGPGKRAALEVGPESAASRSRLAGERLVLSSGGIVLRPHLVYGEGDQHVVPALVRWLRAVPAWAGGGVARTSIVALPDLASVITAFALDAGAGRPGEVFHVADPRPVRMRTLTGAVCGLLGLPLPAKDLSLDEHRARTRAALPWLTEHQWSLLTRDHWYASDRVWAVTGVPPGPGLPVRLAEAAGWYRKTLGTEDRIRRP
ncbi:NAD-dependent epimerase/dehydratase family protein [Amycolatopsis jiangsuensis]|uniref:Nucleoside-diphosphate-sugar epimerase n=1 Tax=Amycolatopsis jiangsuensis TaxID=1181879 RepID=A0A840J5Q0_9PSEU|nr:NAD-dependent epimerase/dehydratase family protein [Amycolatopsis jiangsuensis]MBB4689039.1 nucleoside-diphosphate-sugar epimerase [Amycolatopsis jiangsuensis]